MTPEAFDRAMRSLLDNVSVMTLATCESGAPWAADVYFAPDGYDLVFFSSPRSRHCRHLAINPTCAATIHAEASRVKDIRGLQMEGTAVPVEGAAAKARGLAAYLRKFPFVNELFANPALTARKLGGAAMYVFTPARIRYVDNAAGFGARRTARIERGAIQGEILLESDNDQDGE